MNNTTRKPGDIKESSPFAAGPEAMLTFWKAGFADLPMRLAAEVTHFASQRLRAQSDFLSALNRCGTLVEVWEAQLAFWQGASQDYRVEAGKLVDDVTAVATLKKAA